MTLGWAAKRLNSRSPCHARPFHWRLGASVQVGHLGELLHRRRHMSSLLHDPRGFAAVVRRCVIGDEHLSAPPSRTPGKSPSGPWPLHIAARSGAATRLKRWAHRDRAPAAGDADRGSGRNTIPTDLCRSRRTDSAGGHSPSGGEPGDFGSVCRPPARSCVQARAPFDGLAGEVHSTGSCTAQAERVQELGGLSHADEHGATRARRPTRDTAAAGQR